MPELTKKKPIAILRSVFGQKEGQSLADFKTECDAVKKHANYTQFIQECAAFLGVEADFDPAS